MSGDRVDVLVIAALPFELAAAQAAGRAGAESRSGVAEWVERGQGTSAPYRWGEYRTGRRMWSVALARPTTMGGRSTAPTVAKLVERLSPSVLAMCGVCAGNPAITGLGDVVVAEMAYEWDEGRYTPDGFEPAHQQLQLDPAWLRTAQEFDPSRLGSFGKASDEEALLWLLERLHRGQDPREHPARVSYFPPGTWRTRLDAFEDEGWIMRTEDQAVALTDAGVQLIKRRLYDSDDLTHLPFRVVTGPMASGNSVVADASIWPLLKTTGVRKIAAVDMEAATVATVAFGASVPHWLVVKGVMDHASIGRDDRYAGFAARASAEVLFALLERLPVTSTGPGDRTPPRDAAQGPEATGSTHTIPIQASREDARQSLHSFWEPMVARGLTVVIGTQSLGYAEEWEPSGLVGLGDVKALLEIHRQLLSVGFEGEIIDAEDLPRSRLGSDLVVIGGPDANKITAMLMDLLDPSLSFVFPGSQQHVVNLYDKVAEDIVGPEIGHDGELLHDFGLVVRAPNPLANGATEVVVVAGCWGHGTAAAAAVLGTADFRENDICRQGPFEAVVKTRVYQKSHFGPSIVQARSLSSFGEQKRAWRPSGLLGIPVRRGR